MVRTTTIRASLGILLLLFGAISAARADDASEIECLALNVYHEARGESTDGLFAVAFVTMNRVRSSRYPGTVCEVVWQRSWSSRRHRWIPQFSWTMDRRSDLPKNAKAWKHAQFVARLVYRYKLPSNVGDALWYHADYVHPSWTRWRERLARVGRHIFYR